MDGRTHSAQAVAHGAAQIFLVQRGTHGGAGKKSRFIPVRFAPRWTKACAKASLAPIDWTDMVVPHPKRKKETKKATRWNERKDVYKRQISTCASGAQSWHKPISVFQQTSGQTHLAHRLHC